MYRSFSAGGFSLYRLGWMCVPLLILTAASWKAALPKPSAAQIAVAAESLPTAVDCEVIDFAWPAGIRPNDCLILIGCLGDVGTKYPVTIAESSGGKASLNPLPLKAATSRIPFPHVVPAGWTSTVAGDTVEFAVLSRSAAELEQRTFFLQTGPNPAEVASYQPIHTRLSTESLRVRIWCDVAARAGVASHDTAWLAGCLDDDVLPALTRLYGEIDDLDGDGKLSICLTPQLAALPTPGKPVEGLVQSNDFQPGMPRPFSNQADVMFISPNLRPGRHAQAILAHEAAHLAVFSRRAEHDPEGLRTEEDWLNEGLAHVAETACGGDWSNLADRIEAFARSPQSSPLVVADAQRQGLWRHPGARGAAWSFLNWLTEQYGPDVLTEIARHPDAGCEKLEQVTNTPFAELFRHWSISVWRNPVATRGGHQTAITPTPFPAETTQSTNIVLRGTTHTACRVSGTSSGLRIAAPRGSRLQATVIDATNGEARAWIVR